MGRRARRPRSPLTNTQILIIVAFAAAGAIVQGSVGIGLALVAGPALFLVDPAFAPGPLLVAGQVVGMRHIFVEREHIDRAACMCCVKGLPFGLALGLAVLTVASERTMGLLVGSLTVTAAIALLAGMQIKRTATTDLIGGAACTFSSVTAGLPGPPLIIAFHDMKPSQMRGTSSAFVMLVAIMGFVSLVVTGNFGVTEAELTLWLMPGIAIGLVVSRWVRPMLDRPWFRPLVLTIALTGGLALVVRNLA